MDRREAIGALEWLRLKAAKPIYSNMHEALDLAIEALQGDTESDAESATTTDCISRQQAIEAVVNEWKGGFPQTNFLRTQGFHDWLKRILDNLPPVNKNNAEIATSDGEESTMNQPKSKLESDLISRQAAIELACWRCKKCEKKDCEYKDSCKTMSLLEALPSEDPKPPVEPKVSEDCISRKDAIEALEHIHIPTQAQREYAWEIFDKIPPVEPPKKVVAQIKVDTDEIVERIKEEYEIIDRPVCEDAISKQAAIDAMANALWHFPNECYQDLNDYGVALALVMDALACLPPVTPTEQNEEDILKFYYVESLDEYWIGQRCRTMYYGKWTGNCFTYMYSRYLPWGEHVVAPDTLWKEYTYPSEPKEIPFNEWLQGFLEKECQTERTGEWVSLFDGNEWFIHCSKCKTQHYEEDLLMGGSELPDYCPNCGADMRGNKE